MKEKLFLLLILVFASLIPAKGSTPDSLAPDQEMPIAITNVNYFHTPSATFRKGTVFLQDGKIADLTPGRMDLINAKVINGEGKWLVPGLVDAHVHLFQSGGLYTRPDVVDLTAIRSYEVERQWLKDQAGSLLQRYLKLGITTVIDVGGPMSNFDIRDRYQDSDLHPSLYLTGPLISTYQPKAFDIEDAPIIKAHSAEEAVEMVKAQLPFKPDFIKIWYIDLPDQPASSTYDIVAATIKEAHSHGLRVAVHATELATAKLALKAGADVLVHSVDDPMDEEGLKMIQAQQAVYVPTLVVHSNYDDVFTTEFVPTSLDHAQADPYVLGTLYDIKNPGMDATFERYDTFVRGRSKQNEVNRSNQFKNLMQMIDGQVTVATGTDAGNIGTMHGTSYFDELDRMMQAGMSNADILVASTSNGAKFLGKEKEFGAIEVGLRADLILLQENPLEDIQNLQKIATVIKNGVEVPLAQLNPLSPADLAQQQLNGYNARDIEAFLAPYAEDVEVYVFPNELQYTGKDKMRSQYTGMFESLPDLHCQLVNRIVNGNKVIDQEFVTISAERTAEAVAIYEIEEGKIARVYFIQ